MPVIKDIAEIPRIFSIKKETCQALQLQTISITDPDYKFIVD